MKTYNGKTIDEIIAMSSLERRRWRAANRKRMYAQMEDEARLHPLPEMTDEEKEEGKRLIRKVIHNYCMENNIELD